MTDLSPSTDPETARRSRKPGLLGAIVVLALAAAGYFVFGDDPTPDPSTPSANGNSGQPATENGEDDATRRDADATSGARRTEVDLTDVDGELPQRGLIGLVVDAADRPIRGASVRLYRRVAGASIERTAQRAAWPPDAETLTDDEGRFWFGVDRAGSNRFQLLASQADYASARGFADLGPNEGLIDVGVLTLTSGLRLSGQVRLRANGLPVRGAEVSVHRMIRPGDPPAPEPLRQTRTGFDGVFVLEAVPRARVELEVRSAEFPGVLRRLDLATNPPLEGLQIELDSPHVLAGQVLDGAREPIDSARVVVTPSETDSDQLRSPVTEVRYTDSDGRFRLENLPSGPVRLLAEAQGYEDFTSTEPIAIDQENLEFTLTEHPRVWVVVLAPDGRRLRGFDLRSWKTLGSGTEWLAARPFPGPVTVTESDLSFGRFRFGPLRPGRTVLEARVAGFASSYSDPFDPAEWPEQAEVEIRLQPGATVAGSVLDQRGRALDGARVSIRPRPRTPAESIPFAWAEELLGPRGTSMDLITDDLGRYEASQIAPGRYEIRISHPDHADWLSEPFELVDRETGEIPAARLSGGVQLSGTVEFDGERAPRAEVRIFSRTDGVPPEVRVLAETRTDAEGRFVLPRRLGAGDYYLSVARESDSAIRVLLDHRSSERPLEIRANVPVLELPIEISTRR